MLELLNTTGKRLRALRLERDVSQIELVRRLEGVGVSIQNSYISRIEKEDLTPSAEVLVGIAQVLNTTTDFLLLLSDEHRESQPSQEPIHA